MVSDLPIVTPPNPPGSRQLISPPLAVFEIAPANVLQGAVRLHGFASSPTPDTHVRVAWPKAEAGMTSARSTAAGASLASVCGIDGRMGASLTSRAAPRHPFGGSVREGRPNCSRT